MAGRLLKIDTKSEGKIQFPFELNRQLSTTITLTNTSSTETLAFKMKVNSPKTYLVRPSGGTLGPLEKILVQILLQPMAEKVPDGQHRFLVNSAIVPAGTQSLGRQDWPSLPKSALQDEQLLDVVFVSGETATDMPNLARSIPEKEPQKAPTNLPNDDMEAKLEELKSYALSLEKEIANLQAKKDSTAGTSAVATSGGYTTFHMILAVLIALFIMKIPTFV